MESPGYVTFPQKDGREFRLDPVWEGTGFSSSSGTRTSGKQTYEERAILIRQKPLKTGSGH